MTDTDDRALVDNDGYPTEWGIQRLREFHGAPSALVDLLWDLWWTPTLTIAEEYFNAEGKAVMRVRLATGGWSGNEQIISDGNFHLRFWEPSRRLHIYEVPIGEWDTESQLGAIPGAPPPGWPAGAPTPPPHPAQGWGGGVYCAGTVLFWVVRDLSVAVGSVCGVRASHSGWPTFPRRGIGYDRFGHDCHGDRRCGPRPCAGLALVRPRHGKVNVVRALAAADRLPVETVIGSQREPVDIAGWPVVTDGAVQTLALPDWAKTLINAKGGYLLLDEISTCSASVQAAMLTVALERMVGRTKLPDEVRIVAAANPPDRSAGGVDLTPPMANRFLHIDFEPTAEEWLTGMRSSFATLPAIAGRRRR